MNLNTKISEHQAVLRTQSFCNLHMSGYPHDNRFCCHPPNTALVTKAGVWISPGCLERHHQGMQVLDISV